MSSVFGSTYSSFSFDQSSFAAKCWTNHWSTLHELRNDFILVMLRHCFCISINAIDTISSSRRRWVLSTTESQVERKKNWETKSIVV